LPESGPGSVAALGRRLAAFLIDLLLASLITSLVVRPEFTDVGAMRAYNGWAVLVWFVITVITVGFFGFTPGMAALRIRVARLDGASLVGPGRAVIRTALIAVLIPAVIWDADSRGMHDKAVGTVVLVN
jgi:uncharacterized RDD family membrane protein YckC